jgi:hypothetical protein
MTTYTGVDLAITDNTVRSKYPTVGHVAIIAQGLALSALRAR